MQSFIDHPSSKDSEASLSDAQVEVLREALEVMLAERREHREQSEALFRTLTADRGAPGLEREAARRAAEEAFEVIQRTNQALAQIDAGTYGSCASCARPIPFERLEALPRTQTCVACPEV